MTGRVLTLVAAGITGVALLCVAGVMMIAATVSGCTPAATPGAAGRSYDAEQLRNATTIVAVGMQRNIPSRGHIVALATAMQESGLRNLPHLGEDNDHDSIGLFQQRPSQGWGTPAQLADPTYQTQRFYDKLLTVPGWETMSITQAAQRVQRSAYPDAYKKHAAAAEQLRHQIGPADKPSGCLPSCQPPPPSSGTPAADGGAASTGAATECDTITRAKTWLTAYQGGPVPYSANTDPRTYFHGYRRDCSGYASMALGLPGPGLNTAGLAARSQPIAKTQLQQGDLLINPTPGGAGHVVIFDRWTDATMTAYMAYEQAGSGGTYYRRIPWPYYGTYQLTPYRFKK
jgi:hypothetical protein